MQIQPYLFFDGHCDGVVAFYREAPGAEIVQLKRFGDGPEGSAMCPDGSTPPPEKIMHATLQAGQMQWMMSDGFARAASRISRDFR